MKVLVAIDGSPKSNAIIKEITMRSWPTDTSMCVLYVTNPKSASSHFVDVESYVEAENESAKALVRRATEQLRARGMAATAAIVKGQPAKGIVAYARRWGADFIVLGSHSSRPLLHLFSRNTAKQVLRHAPCSVEIIRSKSPIPKTANNWHE